MNILDAYKIQLKTISTFTKQEINTMSGETIILMYRMTLRQNNCIDFTEYEFESNNFFLMSNKQNINNKQKTNQL